MLGNGLEHKDNQSTRMFPCQAIVNGVDWYYLHRAHIFSNSRCWEKGMRFCICSVLFQGCFIPGIGLQEELYNFIKSTDCSLSFFIWVENQRQKRYVKELFGQKIACDLGLKTVNFKGKYPSWFTVILDMMTICFFF